MIRFEDVGFGYDSDRPVLSDIDLVIPAGQTVALIGPTGCGKTTLTTLIPRFYDVDRGRVLLDGVDVRDLTLESLRAQIGIVAQDTFLFSTTVAENIAYGAPRQRRSRSSRRRCAHRRTSSSPTCPTATTPGSASAGSAFPAVSASGSRSRVRC